MLDVLEQLTAQASILLPALSEIADPSPVGVVLGEQESLILRNRLIKLSHRTS